MSVTRTYSYEFSLPADPEKAFELFSQPELLNSLTPPWFDLRPRSAVPRLLAPGAQIDYSLRWRGLPMRWTSLIVDIEPPRRLTYEQLRGPYRSFVHEHVFEAEAGGTRILDRVVYRAPGGALADRLLVRPDLERIFRHRAEAARSLLRTEAA